MLVNTKLHISIQTHTNRCVCVCDKTHTYYIQKPAISFRFILTASFVLKWKVTIIQYCFTFSPSTDSSASKYGLVSLLLLNAAAYIFLARFGIRFS